MHISTKLESEAESWDSNPGTLRDFFNGFQAVLIDGQEGNWVSVQKQQLVDTLLGWEIGRLRLGYPRQTIGKEACAGAK